MDIVAYVDGPDDVFFRHPSRLARLLATHGPDVLPVRTVVVIERKTGLSSNYRDSETEDGSLSWGPASSAGAEPGPTTISAAGGPAVPIGRRYGFGPVVPMAMRPNPYRHTHHVYIQHMGKAETPWPDGSTDTYGAKVDGCDDPKCPIFDILTMDRTKAEMSRPGSWQVQLDGSGAADNFVLRWVGVGE